MHTQAAAAANQAGQCGVFSGVTARPGEETGQGEKKGRAGAPWTAKGDGDRECDGMLARWTKKQPVQLYPTRRLVRALARPRTPSHALARPRTPSHALARPRTPLAN